MAEEVASPFAFAASAAHALRGPLHVITGFAEALVEDEAATLSDEGRRHLANISAASAELSSRIDGLLSLARLAAAPLDPQPVDLGSVANDVVADLRRRNPQRAIDIEVVPSLPAIADAALMRGAICELVANAWQATHRREHPHIIVGGQRLGGEVELFVRDDGVGFPADRARALFLPFGRAHAANEWPGRGLGLARVALAVRRHGGRVWAEGAPEEGATMHLALPCPDTQ